MYRLYLYPLGSTCQESNKTIKTEKRILSEHQSCRYGVAMRKQNYVQINKCGTNAADWAAGLYYSLNFIVATYSHELPCV